MWGERPTRYLRRWSKLDRGLAEGLLAYEASLNRHGMPPHIARDPDRRFVVDEVVDLADALYEDEVESARKAGGLGHGVHLVILEDRAKPAPSPEGDAPQV